MNLSFQLNGKPWQVDCEPQETLAEVLRNTLNLNGTKVSCEVQVCGACTVLIDGAPVSACTYLAYEARGKSVTTIEGLEKPDGTLHPLQQAFIDEFAFQCGFCTPGMIMSAKALLDENPKPTRDEIIHHMDGNICRCTGYVPIVAAIQRAADSDVEGVEKVSAEKKTDFHVVNHSIPRRDGRVKVTGKAQYVADLKLIGMAYAKVLRSPYAHAKIISIDKSRAEAHPGVYCVVTGYDLDGLNPYFGHAVKDHPLLAIEKVRYAGEPVAAVVAIDERTAFEALEFIDVKYEELKGVFTPEEAMANDAPLLHEKKFEAGALRGFEGEVTAGKGTNICQTHKIQWGDVEKAFKEAASVVEGNYYFPMTYAYAMEPYVVRRRCHRPGRDHLFVGAASFYGAPRFEIDLQSTGEQSAPDRSLCRRRLRQQVVHESRTADRSLLLESQAPGEAAAHRRRSDADDAQRRRLHLDAHGCGCQRQDHRAPGEDLT